MTFHNTVLVLLYVFMLKLDQFSDRLPLPPRLLKGESGILSSLLLGKRMLTLVKIAVVTTDTCIDGTNVMTSLQYVYFFHSCTRGLSDSKHTVDIPAFAASSSGADSNTSSSVDQVRINNSSLHSSCFSL